MVCGMGARYGFVIHYRGIALWEEKRESHGSDISGHEGQS